MNHLDQNVPHPININMSPTASVNAPSEANYSEAAAAERINNFMGHSYTLLDSLKARTGGDRGLESIYETAFEELGSIKKELRASVYRKEALTHKEVKELGHLFKKAEKQIGKALANANIEVLAKKGAKDNPRLQKQLKALARGGIHAKLINLMAKASSTNRVAVEVFNSTSKSLNTYTFRISENESTQGIIGTEHQNATDSDILTNSLKRRAGVIGHEGIYQVSTLFTAGKVIKQLKSLTAQKISYESKREVISRAISVTTPSNKEIIIQSRLIPLNRAFDEHVGVTKVTKVFENVFGATGGVSSTNRQEAHLINGWESRLDNEAGQPIYRALRHAITSDKYEKDPVVRKTNSEAAARELITAAFLQELSDQGLTLEKAIGRGEKDPVKLNFTSVSLVTPDSLRPLLEGRASEKGMLDDQIRALHSIANEKGIAELKIGDVRVNVQLEVNTFNFGVNAGAVGIAKLGTSNQYSQNKKALEGLNRQIENYVDASVISPDDRAFKNIINLRENIINLRDDINALMQSETSYLKGNNQYEVGAKIINLMNVLNNAGGFKAAFNCMSGKDRTGIMDGVAKTYAIMAAANVGIYPTHKQLETDPKIQDQFRKILIPILLEGGGLEITKTNTGAVGYKVTKHALVGGMDEKHFLELIGLSATTSS